MVEEFNIERISEKKALFGTGIIGFLKVYKKGNCKAEFKSLIDKGAKVVMEFKNYQLACKFLVKDDGKNKQKLVRTKKADE